MKLGAFLAGSMTLAACSAPSPSASDSRPVASIRLQASEFSRVVALPVPVMRGGRPALAGLHLWIPTVLPSIPAEVIRRQQLEVTVPCEVSIADLASGNVERPTLLRGNKFYAERFGLQAPPDGVIGRLDDPGHPSKERLELLRQRIQADLDVLLPFFATEDRLSTDQAKKAAQEVRDFFPLAAEPGLWPYYKAEGREFFAWVEKNAPPGKATLPWEVPGAASSGR